MPTARRPTPATITLRLRLFLSSYAPLFVLLALRFDSSRLRLVALITGLVCFADGARLVLWQPRHVGASPHLIESVHDHGSQVAGYLVGYLFPFFPITDASGSDLAAYLLFFAIVGLIYVRSDMVEINPTLYLLGRRVVHVRTDEGWSGFAIVRGVVEPGDVLRAVHLDQGVLIEVEQ